MKRRSFLGGLLALPLLRRLKSPVPRVASGVLAESNPPFPLASSPGAAGPIKPIAYEWTAATGGVVIETACDINGPWREWAHGRDTDRFCRQRVIGWEPGGASARREIKS